MARFGGGTTCLLNQWQVNANQAKVENALS